jgi:hypothetical protein
MLCAALVFALLAAQGAPAFDTSGLDAFWRVQASLARGSEPGATEWDALFATPGYAALEARERRRAQLTQAMRLAFLPSMAPARDSVIRTTSFVGRSTKHLMGVPAARDSIKRFVASLRASRVADVARSWVKAYLPARLADSVAPPPIALVFFLDDGRGYPTIIVGDALRLTRTGVDTAYFAHEFFHFYRRRFAVEATGFAPRDSGIYELLGYPAEEGVADQLDKGRYGELDDADFAAMMARPGSPAYAREYRDAYRRSAEWLTSVSRAIERGIAKPDSATIFARAMRDSIPDSGRALGAFMARAIDRAVGREALIRAATSTLTFWFTYDQAAATSGAPRLTVPAMVEVSRRIPR